MKTITALFLLAMALPLHAESLTKEALLLKKKQLEDEREALLVQIKTLKTEQELHAQQAEQVKQEIRRLEKQPR